VVCPYLWTHAREYTSTDLDDWKAGIVDKVDRVWRVISLVHFVAFIYYGRFRNLADRLCNVRLVQSSNEAVRSVLLDFVNQQLFFDGFVELMVCLLPMIDFAWISRTGSRVFRWTRSRILTLAGKTESERVRDATCVSCGTNPAVMCHRSNCGHSWCYYCIKLENTGVCPACAQYLQSAERV